MLDVLWWLRILDLHGHLITALNFAVFFILDDAAIITACSTAMGGRMIRSHRLRLLIFDVALLVVAPLAVGLHVSYDEPHVQWIFVFWIFVALCAALFLRTFSDGRDAMWDSPPLPPDHGSNSTRRPSIHEM